MTGVYHGDDLVSFLLFAIIFYFVIIEDKDKRNVVNLLPPYRQNVPRNQKGLQKTESRGKPRYIVTVSDLGPFRSRL
jgi:hypothetical protein